MMLPGNVKRVFILMTAFLLVSTMEAGAALNLKKVQVTDRTQIDLIFDGKISANNVTTEFFNDIIQLNLNEAAVYPAKISALSGTEFTKVFAYQYSPKLVRCRFTVKGKAEDFKERIQLKSNGKILTLRIGAEGETSANAKLSSDEKVLLDRIMSAQAAPIKPTEQKAVEPKANEIKTPETKPTKRQPFTSARPLPSPFRSFGMLFAVISVLGVVLLLIRKASRGKAIEGHKGFKGFIGKIANQVGINAKPKMIEMVANHYLGPKKSIAVLRVAGRLLVVGVTNENINLIAQLPVGASANLDETLEELTVPDLGPVLGAALAKPTMPAAAAPSPLSSPAIFSDMLQAEKNRPNASVRAQIRTRLEGMKQL
jgi:flagellar biogenesis protein FliO